MTVTVIFMVIGLAATVGGFFLNIILGVVCGVVVMVSLDADTEVSVSLIRTNPYFPHRNFTSFAHKFE